MPRLPSPTLRPDWAHKRQHPDHARHQPPPALFATTQIAFSFVLLAGAGMLLAALIALQTANTGYDMRQVLALDVPTPSIDIRTAEEMDFYEEVTRRIGALPGVDGVALGSFVPWRDAGRFGAGVPVHRRGLHAGRRRREPARAAADRRAWLLRGARRATARRPRFHGRRPPRQRARRNRQPEHRAAAVPERRRAEPQAPVDRSGSSASPCPRRIVGVVADVDDENVVRGPALTIYHPFRQMRVAGRLFVHTAGDPYALVPTVTQIIREMSAEQAVERAATLEDVRAEVLTPERLNAFVLSGFAGVALLIAVVGVAGVLAFSVSARTREFGVRLAIGSTPRHLLLRVLSEGALIVAVGIVAGAAGGYAFAGVAASYLENVRMPGALPILGAAAVLVGAAVVASLMPAARASRVDVLQALRSE